MQHLVHGYTAPECGKNVNLCLCLIVLAGNLDVELKSSPKFTLILLYPEVEQEKDKAHCFQHFVHSVFKDLHSESSVSLPEN